MAVITDEAINSWREWTKQQDAKCHYGKEDQGDLMAKQVGGNHYKRAHQPGEIIEE